MRTEDHSLDLIRLRGGMGALLLWAVVTPVYGAAAGSIDSVALPFLVLPALILAALGSPVAAVVAVIFFILDVLNSALSSPFNSGAVFLHVGLLIIAAQAYLVARKMAKAPTTPARSTDEPISPDTTAAAQVPAAHQAPGIWRRINAGLVVAALVAVFVQTFGLAAYIQDNGNVPPAFLIAAVIGSGLLYAAAVILVARLGLRHSILIWLAPGLLLVVGLVFLVVACPACTWASR
jgi:hypothetical protein